MTMQRDLLIAILLSLSTGCAADESFVLCDPKLNPVNSIAPRLPVRLHNEYEGKVIVAYTIDKAGRVHKPFIISASWRPVGHSGKGPVGYNEALLTAVARWIYPPQHKPCRKETTVEINVDPSLTGRGGQV
jgi:hypothetical protein